VVLTLVELKDIQLPESMKRAMARQAKAEREKRTKIIAAKGAALAAAALGASSDTMMAHPLVLQLLNLQSLVGKRAKPDHKVDLSLCLSETSESAGERSGAGRSRLHLAPALTRLPGYAGVTVSS
jgi:hypothetical protein